MGESLLKIDPMKNVKFLIPLFTILSVALIIISCGQSKSEIFQVDSGFNEYVSGYTSGMIKRKDVIRIELTDPIKNVKSLSQEKLNSLFDIQPAIDGKAVVTNERLIEFIPTKALPVNQFYTVEFKLNKVTKVKSQFKKFVFQFATVNQKINVYLDGLRTYNDYKTDYQKLRGSIRTTDFEEIENVRKTLTVTLDGKQIPFKLDQNTYNQEIQIAVDSILRISKEQELIVAWDGTPINSFSKGEKKIKVSALGEFYLSNTKVIEGEDQSISLTFTEPIKSIQNLHGIISLEGINKLTYKINRNEVIVYLPNRIVGEKKLTVSTGIKNSSGHKMLKSAERTLTFKKPSPMVRLNSSGSILPNSQGLIFPFEAIALNAVDVRIIKIQEKNVHHFLQVNDLDGNDQLTRFGQVIAEKKIDLRKNGKRNMDQWNPHVIDLSKLITTEPGAIYEVAIKFNKPYMEFL